MYIYMLFKKVKDFNIHDPTDIYQLFVNFFFYIFLIKTLFIYIFVI